MSLYAARSIDEPIRYSPIFETREALEKYIRDNRIVNITAGLVTFIDICPVEVEIKIPWEAGIGSLESRYRERGAGEGESPGESSPVRDSVSAQNGDAPRRKAKRSKRVLSGDGGVSEG